MWNVISIESIFTAVKKMLYIKKGEKLGCDTNIQS